MLYGVGRGPLVQRSTPPTMSRDITIKEKT
jgi:hypothetical protein